MLLQNSPFRELDALFNQSGPRSTSRSAWVSGRPMPMDAYRRGDNVWVHLDLPGVTADSIDIAVERNVLTVTAERSYQREEGDRVYFDERHEGTYRRQVSLGDRLTLRQVPDLSFGILQIPLQEVPGFAAMSIHLPCHFPSPLHRHKAVLFVSLVVDAVMDGHGHHFAV